MGVPFEEVGEGVSVAVDAAVAGGHQDQGAAPGTLGGQPLAVPVAASLESMDVAAALLAWEAAGVEVVAEAEVVVAEAESEAVAVAVAVAGVEVGVGVGWE